MTRSALPTMAGAALLWCGVTGFAHADTYIYYNSTYLSASSLSDFESALTGVGATVTMSTSTSWPTSASVVGAATT